MHLDEVLYTVSAHQCYTENKKWSVIQNGKNLSGNARAYCHISWGWEVVMCGHAQREKVNKLSGFQWISCSTGQVLHRVFLSLSENPGQLHTPHTHTQADLYSHSHAHTNTFIPTVQLCRQLLPFTGSFSTLRVWFLRVWTPSDLSVVLFVAAISHTTTQLLLNLTVCPVQAKCPSHPSFSAKTR